MSCLFLASAFEGLYQRSKSHLYKIYQSMYLGLCKTSTNPAYYCKVQNTLHACTVNNKNIHGIPFQATLKGPRKLIQHNWATNRTANGNELLKQVGSLLLGVYHRHISFFPWYDVRSGRKRHLRWHALLDFYVELLPIATCEDAWKNVILEGSGGCFSHW